MVGKTYEVCMSGLLQDVRHALRVLTRNPGFTIMAVVTLALGIGANTAIFTVVNEAMLRPRPGIGEPGRLVDIGRSDRGQGFDNMSYPNFRDYSQRNTTLSAMAAIDFEPRAVSLGGPAGAQRIYATAVSGNYFDVLQVTSHSGRFFLPEEDVRGGNPAVVLSYAFWQRQFHGDPALVGSTIKLNGFPHAVIGVASRQFRGTIPVAPDVWVPMSMLDRLRGSSGVLDCRECVFMVAVGRLKPGVTRAQAQAEFDSISAALAREYPRENEGRAAILFPSRSLPGTLQYLAGAFLALLMMLVTVILVIASVNVAGMMLARAAARRKDIAVRLAIGGSRSRIIRHVMIEGLMVFMAAGAFGVTVAIWMRDALLRLMPVLPVPVIFDLRLDWRVVAFALSMSLFSGLAASLIPALQASRPDIVRALKEESSAAGSRLRLRSALLVAQIALSVVLLTCAGLFMRAVSRAASIDPGFNMAGLHVVEMDLSLAGLQQQTGTEFVYRFSDALRRLPAVQSANWAWSVPLDGGGRGLGAFDVPGTRSPNGSSLWDFDWNIVTPGYFSTMQIPLLRGRDFNEADTGGRSVAVINETAAASIWPGEDPVGKIFRMGDPRDQTTMKTVEIVGVAQDQKYRSLSDQPRNFVFLPLRQAYQPRLNLMVRTTDPATLFPALRALLHEINPDLPILNILSMRQYAALSMFPQQVASLVSRALGFFGLILSAIGIYAVMAFAVEHRTREIGVRIALGATSRGVRRMLLVEGLRLSAWGIGIGLVFSAAASQMLKGLLYGVSALDPTAFAVAPALVIAVAVLAILVPARRATRLDPLVALRHD
jgi:predicted permease